MSNAAASEADAAPRAEADAALRAVGEAVLAAGDTQVMRIVAMVDGMSHRGPADLVIDVLRPRLTTLRPPRPLRFGRLLFHPLDLVIVPAARWRFGQPAIPRSALMPIAKGVRLAMGAAASAIDRRIHGHDTADLGLISALGPSLWPTAAAILREMPIPKSWGSTHLGERHYRSLANTIATLLAEAVPLDTLHAEAATGLLPPKPEAIGAMVRRVGRADEAVLPMLLAILLHRLPEAADLLLQQLDQPDGIEARIGAGSLAEAGAAAGRIVALLKHLDIGSAKPVRRERVRAVRQRLDADCQERFAAGLQEELLAPLRFGSAATDVNALETAARGLRVLETEGRLVGSGDVYDVLLGEAAEAIKAEAMLDRLTRTDQMRLIEILNGPDAALAMLDGGAAEG